MAQGDDNQTKGFRIPVTKSKMIDGLGQVDVAWITMGDESNAEVYVSELDPSEHSHAFANFILSRIIRSPELSFEQVESLTDDQVREIAAVAGSIGGESEYFDFDAEDARQALLDAIHSRQEATLSKMSKLAASIVDNALAPAFTTGIDTISDMLDATRSNLELATRSADFFPEIPSKWFSSSLDYAEVLENSLLEFASIELPSFTHDLDHFRCSTNSAVANLVFADNQPLKFPGLISEWNNISALANEWLTSPGVSTLNDWVASFSRLDRLSLDPVSEMYSSLQISDRMASIEQLPSSQLALDSERFLEIELTENSIELSADVGDLHETRASHIAVGRRRVERALRELIIRELADGYDEWVQLIPSGTVENIRKRRGVSADEVDLQDFLTETNLGELFGIVMKRNLWSEHFEKIFKDKQEFDVMSAWLTDGRNVVDHSNNLLSHQYNQTVIAINWLARALGIKEPFCFDVDLI